MKRRKPIEICEAEPTGVDIRTSALRPESRYEALLSGGPLDAPEWIPTGGLRQGREVMEKSFGRGRRKTVVPVFASTMRDWIWG